jgi:hypothetical protein
MHRIKIPEFYLYGGVSRIKKIDILEKMEYNHVVGKKG